jgi:hypothetical protein
VLLNSKKLIHGGVTVMSCAKEVIMLLPRSD